MTEVKQWRAEKILTPVKRGRKPGSGKKNIVKAATGKPVFVNVDMSKFVNGSVLLQVTTGSNVECTVYRDICVGASSLKSLYNFRS